jgi:hypothetical protein
MPYHEKRRMGHITHYVVLVSVYADKAVSVYADKAVSVYAPISSGRWLISGEIVD